MEGGFLHRGIWWPIGIKETAPGHALRHVAGVDLAITLARKSIAIQAGGNIGLWPLRMAPHFQAVHTFEPDKESLRFLEANCARAKNITVHPVALGAEAGRCGIRHKGLGSHQVVKGDTVEVVTIDSLFACDDIGLIQLDVEGFEHQALLGAQAVLARCHPVVQLELRGFGERYGFIADDDTRQLLRGMGYDSTTSVGGADEVFWCQRAANV